LIKEASMHYNHVLPYGAAYAAQLRKDADTARLLAETYTTEADLANLDRRFAANALRAFARRIARLARWIEPAAATEATAQQRRPARTTA
jgi:hypothetical protein